jgi:hypothetical protein
LVWWDTPSYLGIGIRESPSSLIVNSFRMLRNWLTHDSVRWRERLRESAHLVPGRQSAGTQKRRNDWKLACQMIFRISKYARQH